MGATSTMKALLLCLALFVGGSGGLEEDAVVAEGGGSLNAKNVQAACSDAQTKASKDASDAVLKCGVAKCNGEKGTKQQDCICDNCKGLDMDAMKTSCACGLSDPNRQKACALYTSLNTKCGLLPKKWGTTIRQPRSGSPWAGLSPWLLLCLVCLLNNIEHNKAATTEQSSVPQCFPQENSEPQCNCPNTTHTDFCMLGQVHACNKIMNFYFVHVYMLA